MENIESLRYAHLPNYDTIHYTVSKIIFVYLTTSLIRKNAMYWEAVKLKIPKSLFLLEITVRSLKFMIVINAASNRVTH